MEEKADSAGLERVPMLYFDWDTLDETRIASVNLTGLRVVQRLKPGDLQAETVPTRDLA